MFFSWTAVAEWCEDAHTCDTTLHDLMPTASNQGSVAKSNSKLHTCTLASMQYYFSSDRAVKINERELNSRIKPDFNQFNCIYFNFFIFVCSVTCLARHSICISSSLLLLWKDFFDLPTVFNPDSVSDLSSFIYLSIYLSTFVFLPATNYLFPSWINMICKWFVCMTKHAAMLTK